ncbi:hypothetical protein NPIL_526011 [Nephila pilipes]|uniref:Uncharacterized protein n=1 Tax=Nephila pilipes TaxID=299642 RepID=A0A8X6PWC4_NEPPI|nr:hypothetical protein NPIL_526011 [Nephila pilipes]
MGLTEFHAIAANPTATSSSLHYLRALLLLIKELFLSPPLADEIKMLLVESPLNPLWESNSASTKRFTGCSNPAQIFRSLEWQRSVFSGDFDRAGAEVRVTDMFLSSGAEKTTFFNYPDIIFFFFTS